MAVKNENMDENSENIAPNRDFHGKWAYLYDWVYETSFGDSYRRMTERTSQKVQEWISSPRGRIADIGAGTGRLTLPLVEAGHEVVAIDPSSGMLSVLNEKLQSRGYEAEVIRASMSDFRTQPVDLALCVFTVFIYITNEEELIASFRNISRHLKPGGLFIFDLASDMFFQMGTVMSHRSNELRRETRISQIEGELFQTTDEISGIYQGKQFEYTETFNVRRWDSDTVFEYLNQCGLEKVEFDDSDFRFTGSRYFIFRKKEVVK